MGIQNLVEEENPLLHKANKKVEAGEAVEEVEMEAGAEVEAGAGEEVEAEVEAGVALEVEVEGVAVEAGDCDEEVVRRLQKTHLYSHHRQSLSPHPNENARHPIF